jgi:hypothetical protein
MRLFTLLKYFTVYVVGQPSQWNDVLYRFDAEFEVGVILQNHTHISFPSFIDHF